MTIFKRIILSLPIGLGMALFMSSVFDLLDAYKAAEQYRAITDPIVDSYVRNGQSPEASSVDRGDLVSELFFIRVDMDHGSHSSIRLRIIGGLVLLGLGAWLSHRANSKGKNPSARIDSAPTKKEEAEQAAP
jgi:hypothetical protein